MQRPAPRGSDGATSAWADGAAARSRYGRIPETIDPDRPQDAANLPHVAGGEVELRLSRVHDRYSVVARGNLDLWHGRGPRREYTTKVRARRQALRAAGVADKSASTAGTHSGCAGPITWERDRADTPAVQPPVPKGRQASAGGWRARTVWPRLYRTVPRQPCGTRAVARSTPLPEVSPPDFVSVSSV